jgi:hypothetical protein
MASSDQATPPQGQEKVYRGTAKGDLTGGGGAIQASIAPK